MKQKTYMLQNQTMKRRCPQFQTQICSHTQDTPDRQGRSQQAPEEEEEGVEHYEHGHSSVI